MAELDNDTFNSVKLTGSWEKTTERLEVQLYRELSSDHPLFGAVATTVARRIDTDDVLFELTNAPAKYAVVHLTWAQQPSAIYPAAEFYASLEAWLESQRQPD